MADIFISYAREDQAWAEAIAQGLAAEGWTVWWDRNLPAGAKFYRITEKELDAARCVLVLWSAESRESDWVLGEADEGRGRGILIPVRIEEVRQPVPFRSIHATSLVGWNRSLDDAAYLELVDHVKSMLGPSDSKEENRARAQPAVKQHANHPPPPVYTDAWGIEYVRIQQGTFWMGAHDISTWEMPDHEVTLSAPFYMGTYPITQGEYERVMGTNPAQFTKSDRHPVEQVSWEDVQAFIEKVNQKEPGCRLPTEAEWEYACRAGTDTAYSFGDSKTRLVRYGWFAKNANQSTHAVGEKTPNPWGLYDMHGNVWEWVADRYGTYSAEAVTDPRGPASGSYRIIRGGSWYNPARDLQSASRFRREAEHRDDDIGFRVVRTIP